MRASNYFELRFTLGEGTIRLFVVLAFCVASIMTTGCQSTGGKSCLSCSDNPENLATVKAPESDSVNRAQSGDVSSATTPSQESSERHNKLFSQDQQSSEPSSKVSSENSNVSASVATTDVSKNEPVTESLDSLDYVTQTTNPANESNIPEVTPAPMASIQSPDSSKVVQNSGSVPEKTEQAPPSNGFISMEPSPNQADGGEHAARSSEADPASEPPVEMNENKAADVNSGVTTFAEENNKPVDSTRQTDTNFNPPVEGTPDAVKSSDESETSQTPKTQAVNPTLDTSVPVTFKPMVFSKVVEIQTTNSSKVLSSNASAAQRSVKRIPSSVGLINPNVAAGKPVDASKDVSHLTRIPRR